MCLKWVLKSSLSILQFELGSKLIQGYKQMVNKIPLSQEDNEHLCLNCEDERERERVYMYNRWS